MSRRKADLKASQEQALAYGQRRADAALLQFQSAAAKYGEHAVVLSRSQLTAILAAAYTVGAQESGGKIQRRNAPGTAADERKEEA